MDIPIFWGMSKGQWSMCTERVVTVYFKYGHTCNSINKEIKC